MIADRGKFVLDSYAVLAFLQGEAGMPRIKEVLRLAEQGQSQVYLSWINLGEVVYITERSQGLWRAQAVLTRVHELPIHLVDATSQVVLEAAHLKAHYPIAYADSFAAVGALAQGATLLTGDPEFQALEGVLTIEWLAR